MGDVIRGYCRYRGTEYQVSWHPISRETYVYWGTWRYAGNASGMEDAIAQAVSWLASHSR
jgi:hypothetical protein